MSYYIVNGTFYPVPVQSNELYHYGVPGMRWGHRKASYYDAKSQSHASRVKTSKTRLGKEYHNYRAYRNEVKAGDRRTMDSLGGKGNILKKADNLYGHGATARYQEAASKYYDRKSGYTKTRLGTTMAKSNAYNNKTAAAANAKLHNSKNLKEYGSNYVNSMFNRSVKTWSGRTTTTGKQYVDIALTGGMIGGIKDIAYNGKKVREAKTAKVAKAKAKYNKARRG